MAATLMSEAEAVRWKMAHGREAEQQMIRDRDLMRNDLGSWVQGVRYEIPPMPNSIYNRITDILGSSGAGAWADGYGTGIADKPKPVPAKPSTGMLDVLETPAMDMENARVGLALEVEDLLGYSALRKDVKAPSRLHRVLAELDLDVFSNEKVKEYKAKMQAHYQVIADNEDRERIQKTRGMGRRSQTVVSWKLVDLAKYGKPVPEHVLRKCVQIKKAAPEATFQVDELTQEIRTLDPFMIVTLGEDKAVIEVWDEPTFEE